VAVDRVVILGAGFAGITLASELDSLAAARKTDVTLVDRRPHFSMGFNMQWSFAGRRAPEEGMRAYASLRARHARFLHDEVAAIDVPGRAVHTTSQRLPYDHLVIALGAELAPELIPGLAVGAYDLFDLDSVMQFREAVHRFEGGTLAIAVAATPFKCPPAPYEYALLVDDLLRTQGVRDRVRLVVTTPEPRPLPLAPKVAGDTVMALLADRGIEYRPGHKPSSVDPVERRISFENGTKLEYGILGAVPPHRAPKVVRDAGLADASGFVPVELGTFRTSAPDVYAVGDVAALKLPNGSPHPKAGVFAEAQALTVARHLAAAIAGAEKTPYAGRGTCFVDVGRAMAAPAEIDLLAEGGPQFRIDPPSSRGLDEKRKFETDRFERWFGG